MTEIVNCIEIVRLVQFRDVLHPDKKITFPHYFRYGVIYDAGVRVVRGL